MGFIWFILVGLLAGFLANVIRKGKGAGFWLNLLIGIVGGWLGGWLLGVFHIAFWGILGNLIAAVIGALILLWLWDLCCGKKK